MPDSPAGQDSHAVRPGSYTTGYSPLRPRLEIPTIELDHAARVTEEAEMDIPSPPFSSCREGILSRQSLQKKIVV